MASVNKVILVGHLGRDPETRYSPDGKAITSASIATTSQWKDKTSGEKMEETEWTTLTFFGKLAEIAGEYLRKGSLVYVEGRLKTDKWADKETGKDRYSTKVIVDQMQMLGGKDRGENAERQERPRQERPAPAQAPAGGGGGGGGVTDLDDDIPF